MVGNLRILAPTPPSAAVARRRCLQRWCATWTGPSCAAWSSRGPASPRTPSARTWTRRPCAASCGARPRRRSCLLWGVYGPAGRGTLTSAGTVTWRLESERGGRRVAATCDAAAAGPASGSAMAPPASARPRGPGRGRAQPRERRGEPPGADGATRRAAQDAHPEQAEDCDRASVHRVQALAEGGPGQPGYCVADKGASPLPMRARAPGPAPWPRCTLHGIHSGLHWAMRMEHSVLPLCPGARHAACALWDVAITLLAAGPKWCWRQSAQRAQGAGMQDRIPWPCTCACETAKCAREICML